MGAVHGFLVYVQEALTAGPLHAIAHVLVAGAAYWAVIRFVRGLLIVPHNGPLSWREVGTGYAAGVFVAMLGWGFGRASLVGLALRAASESFL